MKVEECDSCMPEMYPVHSRMKHMTSLQSTSQMKGSLIEWQRYASGSQNVTLDYQLLTYGGLLMVLNYYSHY